MDSTSIRKGVSRVIELIPFPGQNDITIRDIGAKTGIAKENLAMVLEFLKITGAVICSDHRNFLSRTVRARSEVSYYFLKSLEIYLQENTPVIKDWEHLGSQNSNPDNLLKWGTHLLTSMEVNRLRSNVSAKPIRDLVISQAIIKKKSFKTQYGDYLMRFDPEAEKYQFISWQKNINLQTGFVDPEKLIVDCIESELKDNDMVYLQNFGIEKIGKIANYRAISPTYGAYTNYNFHIFKINFDTNYIKLKQNRKWVSFEELQAGVTKDGHSIYTGQYLELFNQHLGRDLKSLGYSFEKYKKIPSDSSTVVNDKNEIIDLIQAGESDRIEFKASLRWDYDKNQINKLLEKNIVKSIVGFMNQNGGYLLIGVDNKKKILGIENDFNGIKQDDKKNKDGYELTLRNLIDSSIGVEHQSDVEISFQKIEGKDVCLIKIIKSSEPIFLQQEGQNVFYLRVGNQTKPLDIKEAYAYIRKSWE